MKREQIIRAWKDAAYRMSLSDTERATLPENPAGGIELSDAELDGASAALGIPRTLECPTKLSCVTAECLNTFSCKTWVCGPVYTQKCG
jgi:mersacidin/lichenicidin family type 2 lantibiotic